MGPSGINTQRNKYRLGYRLLQITLAFTVASAAQSRLVSADPKPTSFNDLVKQERVNLSPEGVTFTLPAGIKAAHKRTGLSVKRLSNLLLKLERARVQRASAAGDPTLAISLQLPDAQQMRINADGRISTRVPGLTYWVTEFTVKPSSIEWIISQIGKTPVIRVAPSIEGASTVTISGKLESKLVLTLRIVDNQNPQLEAKVIFVPALSGSDDKKGKDLAPELRTAVGRATNQTSNNADNSSQRFATGSGGGFAPPTGGPGRPPAPGSGSGGGSSGGGSPGGSGPGGSGPGNGGPGGSGPGGSGPGGSGPGGPGLGCAKIVLGKPSKPTVAAGDPTLASADADYIPFPNGFLRVALNTVAATIGPITVGEVTRLAVDSSKPQTIFQGLNYAMNTAIGLFTPASSSGGGQASAAATSGNGVLYLGGIGYRQQDRGLGGFQWKPATTDSGQSAIIIEAPGSANNAMLIFGTPNRLGYADIEKIVLARGASITYSRSGQWDAAITYSDPLRGAITQRWSQQPSENPSIITVVQVTQVGSTTFEEALFTFTDMGGGVFNLTSLTDLTNGATYNYQYGRDGWIPAQWSSSAHSNRDKNFGKVLLSFDGITGQANISLKRDTGALQQHPGSPPSFSIPIKEAVVNGRQYGAGVPTLNDQISRPEQGEPPAYLTSFFDVTNPQSLVRQYRQGWQANQQNNSSVEVANGVRFETDRNEVGAVTTLRQIFSNGATWTSTSDRDAHWVKAVRSYEGTKATVEGDPLWPSRVSVILPTGTYVSELAWSEHEANGLKQKLLTSVTERAPSGVTRKALLTWNGDTLTSITDNNGLVTKITPGSVTSLAASGQEMITITLEDTFTTLRYALPNTFSFSSVLNRGSLTQEAKLGGASLWSSTQTFGAPAAASGGVSPRSFTGSNTNAAGDSAAISAKSEPTTSRQTETGPAGTSQSDSADGNQSFVKSSGSCTANGILVCPTACSQSWLTAPGQVFPWYGPALGISSASTLKQGEKFFVKIGYSNTVDADVRALVTRGGKNIEKLDEFALEPVLECHRFQLNTKAFQKASSLKCDFLVTRGDLDQDGRDIPPIPPVYVNCEIDREEACKGFELMLAAGIKNSETDSRQTPGSAYQKGPAFATDGEINGFSGYISNRFEVAANPEMCP